MASDKCPPGQIERVGYTYKKKTTKKTVKVQKTCVEDQGKPGKGPKLIKMPAYDEGLLSDYGYTLKLSHENRVKAIKKSLKENNKLKILQHINALRTLHKSNEKLYNKLDKDLKWIQSVYDKI